MANVAVFEDKQKDKRTGKKLYAPDLSMQEHKKAYLYRTWKNAGFQNPPHHLFKNILL